MISSQFILLPMHIHNSLTANLQPTTYDTIRFSYESSYAYMPTGFLSLCVKWNTTSQKNIVLGPRARNTPYLPYINIKCVVRTCDNNVLGLKYTRYYKHLHLVLTVKL